MKPHEIIKGARRSKQIKKWLIDKELTQAEIAREAGLHRNIVHMTVKGIAKNRKVIECLIRHGCPEHWFEFPTRPGPGRRG